MEGKKKSSASAENVQGYLDCCTCNGNGKKTVRIL